MGGNAAKKPIDACYGEMESGPCDGSFIKRMDPRLRWAELPDSVVTPAAYLEHGGRQREIVGL